MKTIQSAKFELGRVVITPGAQEALKDAEDDVLIYLVRHAGGDWGDLGIQNMEENELALKHGWQIHSAYFLGDLEKIWIITEADRKLTTVLRADEY
jgi:hypothetical protein